MCSGLRHETLGRAPRYVKRVTKSKVKLQAECNLNRIASHSKSSSLPELKLRSATVTSVALTGPYEIEIKNLERLLVLLKFFEVIILNHFEDL